MKISVHFFLPPLLLSSLERLSIARAWNTSKSVALTVMALFWVPKLFFTFGWNRVGKEELNTSIIYCKEHINKSLHRTAITPPSAPGQRWQNYDSQASGSSRLKVMILTQHIFACGLWSPCHSCRAQQPGVTHTLAPQFAPQTMKGSCRGWFKSARR